VATGDSNGASRNVWRPMAVETMMGRAVGLLMEARRSIVAILDGGESPSFLAAMSETENAARRISRILGLSIEVESAPSDTESWEIAVNRLIPSQARDISDKLCRVSEELTKSFREMRKEELDDDLKAAVRDTIGFLYTDILRPLWFVFPDLAPSEMRERPSDNGADSG